MNVRDFRVIKLLPEKPISEMVKLSEEHATSERGPVNRAVTEADFANFKEGTIEVCVTAKEAAVGITARIVEELVVGKRSTCRSQTVSDTVRRTDVEMEQVPNTQNAFDGHTSQGLKVHL